MAGPFSGSTIGGSMRQFWLLVFLVLSACATQPKREAEMLDGNACNTAAIIAHRGASGDLPELTLEAFQLAVDQGADGVELDVVMSADGVPVLRHDRYLSRSTDIASRPEFASRKRRGFLKAFVHVADWWVEDYTLAELKSLNAIQPVEGRPAGEKDVYTIPTLKELVSTLKGTGATLHVELKSPAHFKRRRLDMKGPVLEALNGYDGPIVIQSFEPDILREISAQTNYTILQLYAGPNMAKTLGLNPAMSKVAGYAHAVGPAKSRMEDDPGAYVKRAHSYGLKVYPFTFRADKVAEGYADFDSELITYMNAGIDGMFIDHPAHALALKAKNACD